MRLETPPVLKWLIGMGYSECVPHDNPNWHRWYTRCVAQLNRSDAYGTDNIRLLITHTRFVKPRRTETFTVKLHREAMLYPSVTVTWGCFSADHLRQWLPVIEQEAAALAGRYDQVFPEREKTS